MRVSRYAGAAIALLLTMGAAVADDWVAVKLRGSVLQLVDGEWQRLERGSVVPDSRPVRTLGGGRVTFVRGEETLDVGGNTQIQIHDRGGARPFTTVKQYFGKVEIEAEVKQVQHFAVQTPYLVAVVKGTRFTVTSDKTSSSVAVQRGAVAVAGSDDGSQATVVAGQSAEIQDGGVLQVAGRGELPVVVDAKGRPVAGPRNTPRADAPQAGRKDKETPARPGARPAPEDKAPDGKRKGDADDKPGKGGDAGKGSGGKAGSDGPGNAGPGKS